MADPERYQSALTGPEMDQALLDMANHTSERFAKGTANGVAVEAGTDGYNDNSLYYKNQAASQVQLAANQVSQATAQADRAANAADRAEAAVPAGIDSAVLFTRAQTLTAAQQSQARANIMAGGSNRNLLDNWWWGTGVINQRGISSAPSNGAYSIDRWIYATGASANALSVGSDGITMSISASGVWMTQRLENSALLVGKTLTASALLSDGTIYSGTAIVPSNAAVSFYNANNFRLYMDANHHFAVSPLSTVTVKAVKLELGSVSTLANDGPPNYAEELAKCQYYFRRFKVSSGGSVFFGYMSADNVATFPNIFNIPMRAKPSVTKTGSVYVRTTNNTNLGVTAVSTSYEPPSVSLNATINGSVTTYQIARLIFTADAYLDFSADL